MGTTKDVEGMIVMVTEAVDNAVRYYEGPGATSRVRVGEWGPREVLSHFLFWHEATAKGMESVAGGGEPFRVYALVDGGESAPVGTVVDVVNARVIAKHASESIPELLEKIPSLHKRLVKAVRALTDFDEETVLVFVEGLNKSGRQRMQMIGDHWRDHIFELESEASP